MPGLFFKKLCLIVGEQVIKVVSSFLRDKRMLRELNHMYITLIPKTQGACKFSQLRPKTFTTLAIRLSQGFWWLGSDQY